MTKIYDQYDAAFRNVSAYVVLHCGKVVAKVAFKFGGAVTAYVHWIGLEMTRGQAGGGGYDRQTAAVAYAARKAIAAHANDEWKEAGQAEFACASFFKACEQDGGKRWDDALRDTGFTVIQAV